MPRYDRSILLAVALERVFAGPDRERARALLAAARGYDGSALGERVQLACVLLSAGGIGSLQHYLRQAALDSRDVLYWAFDYDDAAPEAMRPFLARRAEP